MKHDTGGRIAAETWDGVERRADGVVDRRLENGQLDAAALEKQERDKLVMEHLPQVHHIARRIHDRLPPHVALEDLVHAGILGLMDAVKKYDTNKNVELKHYAKFRIRGAIIDSLREGDWGTRALRKQGRSVEVACGNCKSRLLREPSETEVAKEMQISLANYQRLVRDLRGLEVGSLEADSDDWLSGGEERWRRGQPAGDDSYHVCLRTEMHDLLERAMGELHERERRVLVLYDFEELTMKEVGSLMGLGESRVSQIHTEALVRLRGLLQEIMDGRSPVGAGAGVRSRR